MNWSLMQNNITENDTQVLIDFLSQRPIPKLTNGDMVRKFEEEWSKWLGVKYSVFVNSGSSANILTLLSIKEKYGIGEVIVSPLNWVSDIAAIIHAGMRPVFCDINLENLALNEKEIEKKITKNTKAVLLTHILGYNGLNQKIIDLCWNNNLVLIEDVCESHGATFQGRKLGSFGNFSNFSFYYAHHMTSVEGGMICINNKYDYDYLRALRSHGMMREMDYFENKTKWIMGSPDLNTDFIFIAPSYNMRSTEFSAVIALNQLKRLDENNTKRKRNFDVFLDNLDGCKYMLNFTREGNSNYAFTLLLQDQNFQLRDKVESTLKENRIEFRRGMSGGGNQLRQPYLKYKFPEEYKKYPNCEHVHHFGWYIGNYPDLEESKIKDLCGVLNNI